MIDLRRYSGQQCSSIEQALKDMRAKFPKTDETDPEEVTNALQNTYNLSADDADQLGMLVWDHGICQGL